MRDHEMTSGLTMHWVSVTDSRGRTHMEARWGNETHSTSPAQTSHAA
ncbi:hypothetical protein H5V45_11960 [Nocardioides sp. KIGAM211]|uniref:Uncharacterized protein n=1 Tax=Nocardioides luti TaxID=2761101 RepID=A0A7X0VCA1_9ACTN|nr:hypothetical protein [Nocardioides luti]MBB6628033.1 hypothetical protein [Nocardioides luti]